MTGTTHETVPPVMVAVVIIVGAAGFGYVGLTIANSPVVSTSHGASLWPVMLAVVPPLSLGLGWYIIGDGGR